MLVGSINTTECNRKIATTTAKLHETATRQPIATVEVDHVKNQHGFGFFVRLHDIDPRHDVDHKEVMVVAQNLHTQFLQSNSD